jgi:hypothetical protein
MTMLMPMMHLTMLQLVRIRLAGMITPVLKSSIALERVPKKAPWEITYKPKTVAELQEEQQGLVEKVSGLIESDVSY